MGVIGGMAGGEILRSIFGGPVSTRAHCAVAVPKEEPEPLPAAAKQRGKVLNGSGAAPGTGKPVAPAPKPKPVDPKVLRKKQLQADLDVFEDLTSDGPAKPKPKPKPRPAGDTDDAPGPGPSSAKLNGSNGKHHSSATGRSVLGTSGKSPANGSGLQKAKSGMPGPGSARPGSGADPKAATGGVKARSPAVPTNGNGSRALATNHQRQPQAAMAGSGSGVRTGGLGVTKPGSVPAAGQRASGQMPSTSGRPVSAPPGSRPTAGSQQQQQKQQSIRPGAGAARPGLAARSSGPARPIGGADRVALQQQQQRRPGGGGVPMGRRRRDEMDEYDDDFVVDDDEDDGQDWRRLLRGTTGYDPSRFRDDNFDDRAMEASWRQVVAEEKRSERMGRMEDDEAEADEERRRRDKLRKIKAAKKQRTE